MNLDVKGKRRLFVILLAAVVVIWGYNVYQISVGVRHMSDKIPTDAFVNPPPASSGGFGEPIPFSGRFRDPFEPPSAFRSSATSPPIEQDEFASESDPPFGEWTPDPPFRLNGIVGRTAILEDFEGKVHLATAGEVVADYRVRRIGSGTVVIELAGRPITLSLPDN